jgi:methionyl-tRNA synthetase
MVMGMDKLSKDMKACAKAGFGVSYGKWKATQPAVTEKPKAKGSGKVCKHCGKELVIIPRGYQKVFCDAVCRSLYAKRDAVGEPVIKNCEWCGKSFEARRSNHRFCGNSCSALASYYRRKDEK